MTESWTEEMALEIEKRRHLKCLGSRRDSVADEWCNLGITIASSLFHVNFMFIKMSR